jgi:hypothetical protein
MKKGRKEGKNEGRKERTNEGRHGCKGRSVKESLKEGEGRKEGGKNRYRFLP